MKIRVINNQVAVIFVFPEYSQRCLSFDADVGLHALIEASSELIEPLENYFNKVFVLVVGVTISDTLTIIL